MADFLESRTDEHSGPPMLRKDRAHVDVVGAVDAAKIFAIHWKRMFQSLSLLTGVTWFLWVGLINSFWPEVSFGKSDYNKKEVNFAKTNNMKSELGKDNWNIHWSNKIKSVATNKAVINLDTTVLW